MSTQTIRVLFFYIFFCMIFTAGQAIAAGDAPIHIAADHMTSVEKDNTVVFTGDVDAKQADVRIRTDEMTVYYTKADTGNEESKQEVDKLICIGNVEVTRGEWLGTGRKMTYLAKKQQVILTGNAKAWQDQNMVSGTKIIYYLDQGRSEVIGGRPSATTGGSQGSGRVNMTIIQK